MWRQLFVQAPAPCLDLTDFPVKADFFEGQFCFYMSSIIGNINIEKAIIDLDLLMLDVHPYF